jgi:hypothetical protein
MIQDQYSSNPPSEASQLSSVGAANTGFVITPQDSNVLMEHLDEFQDADTDLRTKIVDTVMGKLYVLRPDNTPFDKGEARKVCLISLYVILLSLCELENTKVVLQSLHSAYPSIH